MGTIERVFRHHAQRYHPDNPETGDRLRFDTVLEAYDALKDQAKRAQYNVYYKEHFGDRSNGAAEDSKVIKRDVEMQDKMMSIFYIKRRQSVKDPGVPDFQLERLMDCTSEDLEFHIWYLKAKGWIARYEDGMLAITIEGVDHLNSEHHRKTTTKLLIDRNHTY